MIICGWGRVGRAIAKVVEGSGQAFVVIDVDSTRLETFAAMTLVGDATDDETLSAAGVMKARALVALSTATQPICW